MGMLGCAHSTAWGRRDTHHGHSHALLLFPCPPHGKGLSVLPLPDGSSTTPSPEGHLHTFPCLLMSPAGSDFKYFLAFQGSPVTASLMQPVQMGTAVPTAAITTLNHTRPSAQP